MNRAGVSLKNLQTRISGAAGIFRQPAPARGRFPALHGVHLVLSVQHSWQGRGLCMMMPAAAHTAVTVKPGHDAFVLFFENFVDVLDEVRC